MVKTTEDKVKERSEVPPNCHPCFKTRFTLFNMFLTPIHLLSSLVQTPSLTSHSSSWLPASLLSSMLVLPGSILGPRPSPLYTSSWVTSSHSWTLAPCIYSWLPRALQPDLLSDPHTQSTSCRLPSPGRPTGTSSFSSHKKNTCPKPPSVVNASRDPAIKAENLEIILDSFPHPNTKPCDSAT